MNNYFLKSIMMCLFLYLGTSITITAQEYLPKEQAIEILKETLVDVNAEIEALENNKNMDYFKALSKKKLIKKMFSGFRSGKSTEQVALEVNPKNNVGTVQRIVPLFADSNGKVGTNWIDEELVSLMHK